MFENNGVQYEVITKTEKGKTKSFVVVDCCEIPTNKNGLTKEFMKNFIKTKDRDVRLWYLNICKRLTETKTSNALKKDCAVLDIESLREAFIKKFDLEFIYKRESTYKTYIDELEAELFAEDVAEDMKESA